MTTAAAQLIVPTPTKSRLKSILRRALETLGKHYSHGPYML
jgi:hypothetical protein